MAKKKTTEQFIIDARALHGDRYDYSKVNYIKNNINVIIGCKPHGYFEQTPSNHLRNSGCPECGIISSKTKQTKTQEQFISDANDVHQFKYGYGETKYINGTTRIIITCPPHGNFIQMPCDHLRGAGCQKCYFLLITGTAEQFIAKANIIHNFRYGYGETKYIDSKTDVIITCPPHGNFEQTPNNHLSGNGCPHCKNKTEGKLRSFLFSIYSSLLSQGRFDWCRSPTTGYPYPFDFVLECLKIIFEMDGMQHFEDIKGWYLEACNVRTRDVYKIRRAIENGYTVIHFSQEDVLNDRNDWQTKLLSAIKRYDTPQAIFIEGSRDYRPHIEELARDEKEFVDNSEDENEDPSTSTFHPSLRIIESMKEESPQPSLRIIETMDDGLSASQPSLRIIETTDDENLLGLIHYLNRLSVCTPII